jgi:hypothetical protein
MPVASGELTISLNSPKVPAMDDQWPNDKMIALIDSVSGLPLSQATLNDLRTFRARIQSGEIRTDDKKYVIALCKRLLRQKEELKSNDHGPDRIVVKTYTGSKLHNAERYFRADAIELTEQGYYPISQSWVRGEWKTRNYLIGVLLIFLFGFGIFVLAYLLIVKPDGSLTVTYELRAVPVEEKTCPMCAERVKAAALVCHFCGHKFAPAGEVQKGPSQTPAPP